MANMLSLTDRVCPVAVMTIRNIDDAIKTRLRVRAAMHGRSMEDEARDILRSALSTEIPRPGSLGKSIHDRFAALGGVDLPEIPRESAREPISFDE
jgi:antitoxin FitA